MPQSNKWLRWALVEAAWVSVRLDPYFCAHFANRAHKPAQSVIIAIARRLLEVVWHGAERRPPIPAVAKARRSCGGLSESVAEAKTGLLVELDNSLFSQPPPYSSSSVTKNERSAWAVPAPRVSGSCFPGRSLPQDFVRYTKR
jgi:hypothetical protein